VSDQDFFFDEDEAKPAAKTTPKPATKSASTDKSASAAKSAPAAKPDAAVAASDAGTPIFDQSVTMAIAALLMVIALLVGIIIGFFLGGAMTPAPAATATDVAPITATDPGTGATPGQLTQEQINAGMPAGHVPVDAAGTATATTAP
jgi:hypothetical protein